MSGPTLADIRDCIDGLATGANQYADVVVLIAQRYQHARVAIVAAREQTNSLIVEQASAGFDESAIRSYVDYYQFHNVWTQTHYQFSHKPQVYSTFDDKALPVQKLLYSSEFYHDWVKPQDDMSEGLGVMLGGAETNRIALTCNVPRKAANQMLPMLVREFGEILQPLASAMRTRMLLGEIQTERANFETALALLTAPACVVDAVGKLLLNNGAAQKALAMGTDLQLKPNGDLRLRLLGKSMHSSLSELFATGFAQSGKTFLVARANGKRPLVCTLTPLVGSPSALGLLPPQYMLILSDPEAEPELPSVELVCNYCNLSPAEARTALAMTRGGRIADIAERLKLSPNTVRNQISSVLSKTGCEKQSEVVKLILSLGRIAP